MVISVVGEDLGSLTHRQVLLDGNQDRLLHTAMLSLGYLLKLVLDLRRQAKSHSHTVMVSQWCVQMRRPEWVGEDDLYPHEPGGGYLRLL
jgi:hypothetical protein